MGWWIAGQGLRAYGGEYNENPMLVTMVARCFGDCGRGKRVGIVKDSSEIGNLFSLRGFDGGYYSVEFTNNPRWTIGGSGRNEKRRYFPRTQICNS